MSTPILSIVMSVYNGSSRLPETLESILNQTYRDFEFIIVNDGSTDDSLAIINRYASLDPRIKVLSHDNMGLAASLNRGIREAKGEWIARQDSGDVSHLTRLEEQMQYLAANPHLHILGTQFNYIVNGAIVNTARFPCSTQDIQSTMSRSCCILHGTAIFQKVAFWDVGGYRKEYKCAQDYELWIRFTEKYIAENLPDILYDYHIETTSTTFMRLPDQVYFAHMARWSHYYEQLGREQIAKEMAGIAKEIAGGYLYWGNVVMEVDKKLAASLILKSMSIMNVRHKLYCNLLIRFNSIGKAYKYCLKFM